MIKDEMAVKIMAKMLEQAFNDYCRDEGGKTTDPTLLREFIFKAIAAIYLVLDGSNPTCESLKSQKVSFSPCEEDMC